MLVPIAKIMRTNKIRDGLLFYNTKSGNTEYFKLKDIYEHKNQKIFAGLSCEERTVRLHKYFRNIGVFGDSATDNEMFVVCQKYIGTFGTKYLLVSKVGKSQQVTKEDIVQLIKNNIKVAGVELHEDDKLLEASDIEIVVVKEDTVVDD